MASPIQRQTINNLSKINTRYLEQILLDSGIGAKGKEYCIEAVKAELIKRRSSKPCPYTRAISELERERSDLLKAIRFLKTRGPKVFNSADLKTIALMLKPRVEAIHRQLQII